MTIIRLRTLPERAVRVPRVWWRHYRVFRRYHGRWRSAVFAARLAWLLVH